MYIKCLVHKADRCTQIQDKPFPEITINTEQCETISSIQEESYHFEIHINNILLVKSHFSKMLSLAIHSLVWQIPRHIHDDEYINIKDKGHDKSYICCSPDRILKLNFLLVDQF